MQIWPQLWLLFRLALFVWFFTSPTATWSRWLTIICVAVFIFVLSTGILNGIPDHIWRPVGRHLENLIQLEQPGRRQGAAGQEQQNGERGHQEPDPVEIARRLVAQDRGVEGWILSQIRRLERAGLLFLASIAPGVAERHIATLEAAARAERERREAAEREAEAAAAAQSSEDQGEEEGNQDGINGDGEKQQSETQGPIDEEPVAEQRQGAPEGHGVEEHGVEGHEQAEPAREPLIAI